MNKVLCFCALLIMPAINSPISTDVADPKDENSSFYNQTIKESLKDLYEMYRGFIEGFMQLDSQVLLNETHYDFCSSYELPFEGYNPLCTNITFTPETLSAHIHLKAGDHDLFTYTTSGQNPPPICTPFVFNSSICFRVHSVEIKDKEVKGCLDLEVKSNVPTIIFHFNCFTIGVDEIETHQQSLKEKATVLGQVEYIVPGKNCTLWSRKKKNNEPVAPVVPEV